MNRLSLHTLPPQRAQVELVERKGIGHPDTICDALAETFSRALSRHYRDRFGTVLHHNVDKALLVGGRATPRFGGGHIDFAAVLQALDTIGYEGFATVKVYRKAALKEAARSSIEYLHNLES